MISLRPGGFNLPMTPARPIEIQSRNGNAGNGGRPNPPTIIPQKPGSFPRVKLNPQFRIGEYNNAEQSFHFPQFNQYWKQQRNTNNPINPEGWSNTGGLKIGGQGGNNKSGAGYTTKNWDRFKLSQLGVRGGTSQSFPYNSNAMTLTGGVHEVWPDSQNVNIGEEGQVVPPKVIDLTGAEADMFPVKNEPGVTDEMKAERGIKREIQKSIKIKKESRT
jgi:hypothetical protein